MVALPPAFTSQGAVCPLSHARMLDAVLGPLAVSTSNESSVLMLLVIVFFTVTLKRRTLVARLALTLSSVIDPGVAGVVVPPSDDEHPPKTRDPRTKARATSTEKDMVALGFTQTCAWREALDGCTVWDP